MSKVIVISDVHGTHYWEKAKELAKEHPDYYVVGLGDWVDSCEYDRKLKMVRANNKWPDQGENLKNALDWFREDQEHRFFCIGNHDWSYWSCGHDAANCSGHQYDHAQEIRTILNSNKDIIHVGVEIDGWVFSHAGFTSTWRSYMIQELHNMFDKWPEEDDGTGLRWDERNWSLKFLDDTFRSLSHFGGDPDSYPAFDELLDWHGVFSSSGNEIMQGPLWIRPEALLRDALFPNQVVGHTDYCVGEPLKLRGSTSGSGALNTKIVVVDSPDHDLITIFDTENPGDDFITFAEYNRWVKKVNKTINIILSQQLTDKNVIVSKLLDGGIKKELVKKYYELLGRFDTFKGEPWG